MRHRFACSVDDIHQYVSQGKIQYVARATYRWNFAVGESYGMMMSVSNLTWVGTSRDARTRVDVDIKLTGEDAVKLKLLIDVGLLLLHIGWSIDRLGSHIVDWEMPKRLNVLQ